MSLPRDGTSQLRAQDTPVKPARHPRHDLRLRNGWGSNAHALMETDLLAPDAASMLPEPHRALPCRARTERRPSSKRFAVPPEHANRNQTPSCPGSRRVRRAQGFVPHHRRGPPCATIASKANPQPPFPDGVRRPLFPTIAGLRAVASRRPGRRPSFRTSFLVRRLVKPVATLGTMLSVWTKLADAKTRSVASSMPFGKKAGEASCVEPAMAASRPEVRLETTPQSWPS